MLNMEAIRHQTHDVTTFDDREAADVISQIEDWKPRLDAFQQWLIDETGFEWEQLTERPWGDEPEPPRF